MYIPSVPSMTYSILHSNLLFYPGPLCQILPLISYLYTTTKSPTLTHNSGKNLSISAIGTVSQKIEKGATATVSVKYGLIKILTQEVDLCEQAEGIDLKCPIEAGDLDLSKMVALPKEIPPVRLCPVHFARNFHYFGDGCIYLRRRRSNACTNDRQGKYTVLANVLTKDQDTITCLEATVAFRRGFLTGGDDL